MSIAVQFETFCSNLAIPKKVRTTISDRYEQLTQRLNNDFRGLDSKTAYSFYTGSFGRGTAIQGFSDLDMVYILPGDLKSQYDRYAGNGQSALLQAVKTSISRTYSTTDIGGDGQVVVVKFLDGLWFDVVPVFTNNDGSYTFPDSNDGGSWKRMDPKPEIQAINGADSTCNGNLRALSRMMRAWRATASVPMGGLLIDTLAYNFMASYAYSSQGYLYYDWLVRDFLKFLADCDKEQLSWLAPGSNQKVYRRGPFEYKALVAHNIAKAACEAFAKNFDWTGAQEMRKIFGTAFPEPA